ncbi:MAG: FadR family transcriptional regulator [Candidatus Adiutrix sp.]|jgi:DNA-binding FadR family transcriptional regulator|nr:FadR family transcriptional regulator [Candidatus Adiutrix sp.]
MNYFTVNDHRLKSEIVAAQLRDLILVEKKYNPNDRVPNEQVLAEHMGVSRTSIREAVKILVAKGILTIRRGIGTFVSEVPGLMQDPYGFALELNKLKLIDDWYQFRIFVEPRAMELVALNATQSELALIRRLAVEHNEAMAKDGKIHLDTDRLFHMQLAISTHNIIMAKLLPSMHDSLYWTEIDVWVGPVAGINKTFNDIAFEGHLKIVEFLEMRDAQGAGLEMRYHIQRGIKEMKRLYPHHFHSII